MSDPKKQLSLDMTSIMLTPAPPTSEGMDQFERDIQKEYPGVPTPYCISWQRSDADAPHDLERTENLEKAAVSLERAAQLLRQLATRTDPMTPSHFKSCTNKLAEAIGRAEAQLSELRMDYPLPLEARHALYDEENIFLRQNRPRILLNREDRIIIWLPRMPRISRANNNLVFAELHDLLHLTALPHISQWHCDFIHVFEDGADPLGIRDVDNYPYKPVIDALSRALRTWDTGFDFSCAMYNITSNSIAPGSYINICKKEEKVQFFTDFETSVLPFMALLDPEKLM